ncbi:MULTISPECIES: replication-associated recombination protein A [Pelosinus]|jgi:putative ATPase|uniref:Replication-associated recombination protein A n=1 Tax=Pelosinus fermentans B4 TaxID=1149862 RepID=I9LDK2_9FIRM|nr:MULTISPECIES: replication-associated recombination protein A [Pelosinus]EIW18406.1 MgsA AAA+ ATPase domain-containing protein [Pelosinus fermentans B4]EIW24419.1 AAA ATPase central domain protein [Pelosinus fermentans A11]OAM94522.1 MgsA AAA+ ATPase domain-containing protein [Pelosinus fermentans DSM 17108]SDR11272.1 putative ATPase [Pelosinus fermentans]
MDLFSYSNQVENKQAAPLAVRMRPRILDEFIGQNDIIGEDKFLRRMIDGDNLPSMILFGPPGTGKTTLAQIVANSTGSHFEKLNAVSAGIADIRKIVEAAQERLGFYRQRTIVFIDEIHRFNKGQQDVLLPYVEDGRIILIGATTENPYFEVNAALLSRMRVIRLKSLGVAELVEIMEQAIADHERGLGKFNLVYDQETLSTIADLSGGDARVALNILEQSATMMSSMDTKKITISILKEVVGERIQPYDKSGDHHYDIVSAFIKSMRGSDADAAVHYLARMVAAGEDVKFIARRIVICAAEDVGNADPQALVVAMAAAQAVQFIGMPEARIILSQAVIYIATAPKSNACYMAIDQAINDLKQKNCGQVPPHLRDAHYQGAEKLGHGANYLYPHNYEGNIVKQQYLPDALVGTVYYRPSKNGKEENIKK